MRDCFPECMRLKTGYLPGVETRSQLLVQWQWHVLVLTYRADQTRTILVFDTMLQSGKENKQNQKRPESHFPHSTTQITGTMRVLPSIEVIFQSAELIRRPKGLRNASVLNKKTPSSKRSAGDVLRLLLYSLPSSSALPLGHYAPCSHPLHHLLNPGVQLNTAHHRTRLPTSMQEMLLRQHSWGSLTVLESFLFLRNRVGSLLQDPSAHNSLAEEQLSNLVLS